MAGVTAWSVTRWHRGFGEVDAARYSLPERS